MWQVIPYNFCKTLPHGFLELSSNKNITHHPLIFVGFLGVYSIIKYYVHKWIVHIPSLTSVVALRNYINHNMIQINYHTQVHTHKHSNTWTVNDVLFTKFFNRLVQTQWNCSFQCTNCCKCIASSTVCL